MPDVLTRRALGRATLARQLLLERSDLPVTGAVAHICGLQAQTPHSWYTSLWSRLAAFDPEETSAHLQERRLVRIAVMRGTIHLLTADDALAWRPLLDDFILRATRGAFGRHWKDLDLDAVAAEGRVLLEERPLTFAALGAALEQRFPGRNTSALGQLVRARLPLVQVPPRGLWGRSGAVAHTTAEHWLGRPLAAEPDLPGFIRRYLAGFGPATVMDVQTHCGLTRLKEVVQGMDDLRTFTTEEGKVLYDLPDAPRPDPETPAPVRLLPDYDNVLISFADRSRTGTIGTEQSVKAWPEHGPVPGTVLLDGTVQATWSLARAAKTSTLTITPFRPLTAAERTEIEPEAAAFLAFQAPNDAHDLRFDPPW
ncbi:winged helix DNA-binding domain-containing protein [Actinocorallia longicatena]|uniref:Winged helix DNA-binding domain-containing protein n=1 Tax=Actinocorallia longicatena TaxID=111803 RepID=A0ABP6QJK5_9ACTN